ncbi:MAG: hypothetical protein E6J47_08285 [Chloroflexi bacterium]|nr:MAG: hypothetical protein E6J47_08285 [Chloroflexota bacterium]
MRVWGALVLALLAGLAAVVLRPRAPRTEAEARARLLQGKPAPGDLNVVLVTIDTLRADRLGCYGFAGIETPEIDRLAREGVLFERVTTAVPLTLPAHASIFTGLLPPHHGVRDNGGFFLDASKTTLAERLRGAGYATGAFVGAWVLESKWGLARGFDTYADKFDLSKYRVISLGTVQKKGDEVMDGALAWLETVRKRKFFAWVHLYDPHTPYDPPEPYRSRHPGEPYLGEVAYTDHVVGRLLDWLRNGGLMERTLVVLTADHGESLGEHGEATHGFFIYGSTTQVPLIVRTPWGHRGRNRSPVASVDIFPTVLDLVGVAPEGAIDGRSLVRAVMDRAVEVGHASYVETYFPRYHFGWQHLRGLRDGVHQFVEAPRPELYDLEKDPGETTNVYKAYRRRAEELSGTSSTPRPCSAWRPWATSAARWRWTPGRSFRTPRTRSASISSWTWPREPPGRTGSRTPSRRCARSSPRIPRSSTRISPWGIGWSRPHARTRRSRSSSGSWP